MLKILKSQKNEDLRQMPSLKPYHKIAVSTELESLEVCLNER